MFLKNCRNWVFLDGIEGLIRQYNSVAYNVIADIIKLVFPQSKSSVFRGFIESMEELDIPEAGKAYIVHYDEQFPKKGRCQKFRLTLLDAKTKKPIAEELFDNKDSPT